MSGRVHLISIKVITFLYTFRSVADPGFPKGVPTPDEGVGDPNLIIWNNFCRKLHENENNQTEKGRKGHAALDPPLKINKRDDS